MFNRSKYKKILIVMLCIVLIAIIGVLAVWGYKMYNAYYINIGAAEAVSRFEEDIKNNTQVTTKYKDFTIIGTIQIPKIDFKYPILQENSTEALETSVVLMYTSQGLNNAGNSVIVGHNYRNGTMFSNLNKLCERDKIYITDTKGRIVEYEIYSIYETTESGNDYIIRNTEGRKEITLSTSTDDSKSKIIIFAKEK